MAASTGGVKVVKTADMARPGDRKKWSVAVAGAGAIGRMHIAAWKSLGATVAALSSRRAEQAREVGQAEGCDFTTDAEALVRRPGVDIVSITSSSGSHARLALAAIGAGKHVVVEKPMAMNTADANRMIAAASARGVVLAVISQRRFETVNRATHRAVSSGALGRLLLIEVSCPYYRSQEYYGSADWRGTIADDGGALMNQSIHSVDLMLWMGGPARDVFGRIATQTHRMEAEDLALAQVSFASGAFGTVMASTSIRPGFPPAMNIYGELGAIKLEGAEVVHWSVPGVERPSSAGAASAGVQTPQLASHEHHQAQLADMLDALENRRRPAVTGEDGRLAVALVEGVYQSAAAQRPVPLS
jgi:UDP-N-acetyl-2-amino-2-deoxyglucuronate dehydrogenase